MKITVNGVELYYEVCGSGEPYILLHGNGEEHSIFNEVIPLLARDYTVYAVDSRGHGQSGQAPLSYGLMAEDIAGLIRGLKLNTPSLFGFSDGGIIGLILASRYPDLLKKLTVSGANLKPNGMSFSCLWSMRLSYLKRKTPLLKLMITEPHISLRELRTITAETLVLAGQYDLIRRTHTERIARNIPSARLKILSGETHDSYVTHSEKLYEYLK